MRSTGAWLLGAAILLTSVTVMPRAEADPDWRQPYLRGGVYQQQGWNNSYYNPRYTNNWNNGNRNGYWNRGQGNINQRQAWQDNRISYGIRNGSLTAKEAEKLRDAAARLRDMERDYREDGLTRTERERLKAAQNRLSSRIYREMRDNQYR